MRNLFLLFVIYLSKLCLILISFTRRGAGSTWPGHVALNINKSFIKDIFLRNSKIKIFLITGTNGKTTTAKLLKFLLEKKGERVFFNPEGANLLNGVASSIVKNINYFGKLDFDYAIFEVDENTLPLVLEEMTPYAILILNLFRDQLDRYGEVNTIAKKWADSLKNIDPNTRLFLNGDDPQIYQIGSKLKNKTYYFGLSPKYMSKKELSHDVDSIYCPICSKRLDFELISYSHLGTFKCRGCKFKAENVERFDNLKSAYPLPGKYNVYNTNALILTVKITLGFDPEETLEIISGFKPAFGRQENIKFRDRNITILLSKNPTGFNQSIATLSELPGKSTAVLLVLNDEIPDGKDISWIWDVDFENIMPAFNKIFISGKRAFDLGIRFRYILINGKIRKEPSGYINIDNKILIISDINRAVDELILQTKKEDTLFILPTYSAMLEIRKILTGRKLL